MLVLNGMSLEVLKCGDDCAFLMSSGSVFQNRFLATEEARSPYMEAELRASPAQHSLNCVLLGGEHKKQKKSR